MICFIFPSANQSHAVAMKPSEHLEDLCVWLSRLGPLPASAPPPSYPLTATPPSSICAEVICKLSACKWFYA